jgi:uncharacterized protein
MTQYSFPLGIAKDAYFCNRTEETKALISNIDNCVHTVLVAPRRYGKTSLAYRAISHAKKPYAKVDLYMATSHKDIERSIIKGVNTLIGQVSGVTQKLLESLKDYIKSLRPVLQATEDGFKVSLEPGEKSGTPENICEALHLLDQILSKKKKKAVLLIDEFQEVMRVADHQGIEGAIRHVAQETQSLTLIFSGSRRHLLKSMFNDRNKPLYRLCDEITLERISKSCYTSFINRFAKAKWQKPLSANSIDQLVMCTQRHPYYMNALLKSLFALKAAPSAAKVAKLWQELVQKKRSDLLAETKCLKVVHKKLIVAIANGINTELTGRCFLAQSELSSASVVRGLEYLVSEDFIEKKGATYLIVDPLLETVIKSLQVI